MTTKKKPGKVTKLKTAAKKAKAKRKTDGSAPAKKSIPDRISELKNELTVCKHLIDKYQKLKIEATEKALLIQGAIKALEELD